MRWSAGKSKSPHDLADARFQLFSVAEERSHIRSCWFVFRHCWGSRFVIQGGLLLFHADFMRMQPLNYSNWRIDIAWILLGHKCPYCGPCGVVRCYLWLIGAWRSPVAHCTGGAKVTGSNPVAPTIRKNRNNPSQLAGFFIAKSGGRPELVRWFSDRQEHQGRGDEQPGSRP